MAVSNSFTEARANFALNAAVNTFRDRPFLIPPLRPAPRILFSTILLLLGFTIDESHRNCRMPSGLPPER